MFSKPFELPEIDLLADLLPAFEFDGLIAQGGMGAVYKARQRSLDRDVAIKILPRELGADPVFRSSFQAEAKAMARLTHPNLIRVYDSGDLDGILYIVMEYVPGKSLFHSAHGMAVDSKQAVEIVIATCRGLAHAHENGIIHRDIKPANILLTPKCEPKIGDFGLARCTRSNDDGLAMGTPEYMAPEIIHQPEKGDPQSDVYAIGVVLRELLTGVTAGTADASHRRVSDPRLDAICRTATHPDPAFRYSGASALAEQLTLWMMSQTIRAVPAGRPAISHRPAPASQVKKPASEKRTLLKNCAIISALLCAGYLAWGVNQKDHNTIAGPQQDQGAKPSLRTAETDSKPDDGFAISRELVTAPSDISEDSSF